MFKINKIFLFLLANALLVGGIFAARLLGFNTDSLLVLTTAVSLEIIYLAFSIQRSINKTAQTLQELEKQISQIKENEEKTHTSLIYLAHQMKPIQHPKLNGNGHHLKAHA